MLLTLRTWRPASCFSSQMQINHPLDSKLLILCHLSAVIISLFIWNLWTSILFISLIKAQMHRATNIRHLSTHQCGAPPLFQPSSCCREVTTTRIWDPWWRCPNEYEVPTTPPLALATFTATTGKHGSHTILTSHLPLEHVIYTSQV